MLRAQPLKGERRQVGNEKCSVLKPFNFSGLYAVPQLWPIVACPVVACPPGAGGTFPPFSMVPFPSAMTLRVTPEDMEGEALISELVHSELVHRN